MDRVLIHVDEVVADRLDDIARDLELAAGVVADAAGAGDVAAVVIGQRHVVVARFVEG